MTGAGALTIGVVIPCRNEAPWIAEVLDALAAQDRQPDEIVVVDDGSTDGTADVVRRWAKGPKVQGSRGPLAVRVIAGPARGVAAAVNAGIATLRTEIIVRLDGHCRPAADYVRRAAELATAHEVGVAGGAWTITASAPTLEARAIAIAGEHPLGSGGAAYRRAPALEDSLQPPQHGCRVGDPGSSRGPQALSVDTVPFGSFRRSLWEELGGLDDRLWSNEDYDFNFRVRRRGLRVMLDPAIRCTYYARPTLAALAQQYARYGWWKLWMLVRHPTSIRLRQLLPALLIPGLLVCSTGLVLRHEPLWPALLALYPAGVALGAAHAAIVRREPWAVLWIAAAFFTIHLAWSAGFWAACLAGQTQARSQKPEARSKAGVS